MCFKQFYLLLKPSRWITVEFHNSKNSVWNCIQEAMQKAKRKPRFALCVSRRVRHWSDGAIIGSIRPNASARSRCGRPSPRVTTDEPGGDAGELSTPAPVRFPVKPTRQRSSADTKIRSLSRIEFGHHGLNPSSPSHHSPSAATRHNSQAKPDPRIQQKSPLWAGQ